MKRAGDAANWKPGCLFPFAVRAILESRNQRKNTACDELKLDKIWWGINEKKKKEEERKEKKRKRVFLYQKRFFSENCLKLQHFPHWFPQEAMHCYLKPKRFLSHYKEKLRHTQTAQNLVMHGFKNVPLSSVYFPQSRQLDRQMRVYSVTLKKRCGNKTMMEQNTGDLKDYKTICCCC